MDPNSPYFKQVQLLVQVLPIVAKQECFALKGGTAINLFLRALPRLSVDIDLVYLPIAGRDTSLEQIEKALLAIQAELETQGFTVTTSVLKESNTLIKLIVANAASQIKIEVNPVLRGTVHAPVVMRVHPAVEQQFGFAEIQLVDFNDLYAGKLCAALDRQHPRDLFDVKILLENEGIDEMLKNTFLVYLISHGRPLAELLAPNWQSLEAVFAKEFEGMTTVPISNDDLIQTREAMLARIKMLLTENDKAFLLGLKQGNPDWASFAYPQAQHMPAVRWKLHNLQQMNENTRQQAAERLAVALNDTL